MTYYNNPYLGYYPAAQPIVQQPIMYPQQQVVEQSSILPTQVSATSQNMNVQSGQTNNSMDSYMIWVQGKAGAQSYPVARGTTLPLFDSEGDFLYIKSVDTNGIPLPLVTKVLADPPIEVKSEVVETSSQIDMSNYVTRDSYDALAKKYAELENRILDLETKPSSGINTTFTGNTFNNSRKGGSDNGYK